MAYSDVLKKQLTTFMPAGLVVYMKGWEKNYTGAWNPAGAGVAAVSLSLLIK